MKWLNENKIKQNLSENKKNEAKINAYKHKTCKNVQGHAMHSDKY